MKNGGGWSLKRHVLEFYKILPRVNLYIFGQKNIENVSSLVLYDTSATTQATKGGFLFLNIGI